MNRDEALKALDAAMTKMQEGGRYTPEDVDELEKCARDVLDLLKAQEPRVMTLEELQQSLRGGDTVFLLEVKGSPLVWTLYMGYSIKEYGMTWRC